ncbi:MAG: peptide chain release factor N(5)-glutamine methyltransferase [Agriterribacter sp.]
MTITESYRYICNELYTLYEKREAENIADMVIENITGLKRMDRVLQKDIALTKQQQEKLNDYLTLLLQHKPVQYVLQEAWFYGMKLFVDENVLIPRPETEELVEWIVQDTKAIHQQLHIIDIGTGSGCIPIALKKNIPGAEVWAIDISSKALEVAKRNGITQQTNITFQQADILKQPSPSTFPLFDIIVSNPPYIPKSDEQQMQPNVLEYEPHLALFVDDEDPLLFYNAIADFAQTHLQKKGSLYFEIHESMGEAVKQLLLQKEFSDIVVKKDMQGKDRMVKAGRNK